MLTAAHPAGSLADDRVLDVARALLADLRRPSHDRDPEEHRRRRAEWLVTVAGGQREMLEELRLGFIGRLHRAGDDFEATEGLRVVERALSLTPWPSQH